MRYSIGQVASMFNLSTNTIRRCEEQGLITSQRDPSNGYRYFTIQQINEFVYIRMLRNYGFSYEAIQKIKKSKLIDIHNEFTRRIYDINQCILSLNYQKSYLEELQVLITEQRKGIYTVDYNNQFNYFIYEKNGELNFNNKNINIFTKYLKNRINYKLIYVITEDDWKRNKLLVNRALIILDSNSTLYNDNSDIRCQPSTKVLRTFLKVPVNVDMLSQLSCITAKNLYLNKEYDYLISNNYIINGNIYGTIMTCFREEEQDMQLVMVDIPIVKRK